MKKIQQRRGATVGCAAVIAALSGCVTYSDGGYGSHSGSYGNPSSTTPYADGRPANANSNGAYVDSYEDEEGTHGSTYYEAEAERRAYEDAERRAAQQQEINQVLYGIGLGLQNMNRANQYAPALPYPAPPSFRLQPPPQVTTCRQVLRGYLQTPEVECTTR